MSGIGLERPLDGRLRLRVGPLAPRLGHLCLGFVLVSACFVAALVSLTHGTTALNVTEVVAALRGEGSAEAVFAVREVRLPRILLGLGAGFVVAMAGAVLQTLARNPLADPGLLGLSQGAMLAAMLLLLFAPQVGAGWRALGATAGALTTGLFVLAMIGPARAASLAILLMGLAVETTLSAVSSMLIVHSPPELSYRLSAWMMGVLDRGSWSVLWQFLPWAALSVPLILLSGRTLRAYELGDDLARAIGEPTGIRRAAILLVVVALVGASTAAVGPLLFLGVMAPHLANALSPATGAARLWLSGLMGALLVTVADAGTRLLGDVAPLPLGLWLVLVGVPLFVTSLRLVALRRD